MGYRFRIEFVSDLDKDTGVGAELDALFKTPRAARRRGLAIDQVLRFLTPAFRLLSLPVPFLQNITLQFLQSRLLPTSSNSTFHFTIHLPSEDSPPVFIILTFQPPATSTLYFVAFDPARIVLTRAESVNRDARLIKQNPRAFIVSLVRNFIVALRR